MQAQRLLFPQINQVTWEPFEVPDPPAPHTVVARSLCSLVSPGTELALFTGTHIGFTIPEPPFPMMPHRPGYAMLGEVHALGSSVQGLRVGQRVLWGPGNAYFAGEVPFPDGCLRVKYLIGHVHLKDAVRDLATGKAGARVNMQLEEIAA